MEKFYFETPTIKRKIDALEFVQEFYEYGVDLDGTGGLIKHFPHDYEGWLKQLEKTIIKSQAKIECLPIHIF